MPLVLAAQESPSTAGSSADPWAGVEEMIVSGGSGVGALLAAPTSVVAFDSDALKSIGALNIAKLADYTPNLEINSPYAASNPQLFIRGVGLQDSNSNASSAVAVVVDNVYVNSPAGQLAALLDVQTVEVLRGPQGAKYGRNASAGVVRIVTNRPEHEVKAGTTMTYGRFNQAEVEGFINVPVVQDVVATRIAFKYVRRDPLGENRCHDDKNNNFPVSSIPLIGTKCFDGLVREPSRFRDSPLATPPKQANDRENWYGRWGLLVEPNEGLSFNLNIHGGENLSMAPQFQLRGTAPVRSGLTILPDITATAKRYVDYDTCHAFLPNGDCLRNDRFPGAGDPFSGDWGRGGKERLMLAGATLNTDWTNGPLSFTSVTNVETTDREIVIDFDATPYVQADAFLTDRSWQVLEDAKLIWDDDQGLTLTVGGQYMQEELNAFNSIWNSPSSNLLQDITQATLALAAFAYVEWELTENVTFEGGARLNYERKNFQITSTYAPFVDDQIVLSSSTGYENRRKVSDLTQPSGEMIMRYEPTDDVKFYTRFTRGLKGRHFNGNALSDNQSIQPKKAEYVNAFEVGWDTRWFDSIVSWTGAGFFYDYENQQVYQLLDAQTEDGSRGFAVPQLINAKDSRLIGLESDLTLSWEGIRWSNSLGMIYSEYSDFKVLNETIRVDQTTGQEIRTFDVKDYSGNLLVNAPALTLVGSISYVWEVTNVGTFTPRFDYRYKSQVFFSPENDSRIGNDPYWMFDARLDYKTLDGNIEVGAWIQNILDQFYAVTAYDRKKTVGAIVYVPSQPRTFGVTLTYRY
ncbi:MAG: TonB-dependent receptor [Deltaproteobacteria bacterium]|nr:TonB-dependent receptor [Deltaproteobacteria bacterium]